MCELGSTNPFVSNNCITVKDAAFHSGYNIQNLRRMLRSGALGGVKIGQMLLVDKAALDLYIEKAQVSTDQRFGPTSSAS